MNEAAQRIAIAEACGWHTIAFNRGWIKAGDGETQATIPDYLNDLNAMHEAVETLRKRPGTEWFDFQKALMEECGSWMNCIQATAAQRAEAFLRTLNRWKE